MTIKSIRQAHSIMRKRFPGKYVSTEVALSTYSNTTSVNIGKRVYTNAITTRDTEYGVSGEGETWEEAFTKLDEDIRRNK